MNRYLLPVLPCFVGLLLVAGCSDTSSGKKDDKMMKGDSMMKSDGMMKDDKMMKEGE